MQVEKVGYIVDGRTQSACMICVVHTTVGSTPRTRKFPNLLTNFPPLSLSVMTSSVSTKYLLDHFYPHFQSPRLTKTCR